MPYITYISIIAALTSLYILRVQSKPFCPPCHLDNSCKPQIEECEYEVVIDHCGQKVCSKGPGQRCGGAFNVHGICAHGLYCECNKCRGCTHRGLKCSKSETLLCFIKI